MPLHARRLIAPSLMAATTLTLMPGCAGTTRQDVADVIDQIGSVVAGHGAALSEGDILSALRQALAQGSRQAIQQLGRNDGFWGDAEVRVPLPAMIGRYESAMRSMGFGSTLDQFQLTMNRAAEQAVPLAAGIIYAAVGQMTATDAREILQGPPDAATQFFRRSSSEQLVDALLPIVEQATADVGVTQQYKKLVGKAGPIMRLSGHAVPPDLDTYITQKALDGVFLKIAAEEARIRADPAARGTELMRKVFARQQRP